MLLDTPASMKKLDLQPNLQQLGTATAVLLRGEEHNLTILIKLVSYKYGTSKFIVEFQPLRSLRVYSPDFT